MQNLILTTIKRVRMRDFKIYPRRKAYSHSLFVSHCLRLCCHNMGACLITLINLLPSAFPRNFYFLLIPDSSPYHLILCWITLNEIHEEKILWFRSSCESVFSLFSSYDLISTYYPQERDVRHLHLPSFRIRNNFHTPIKDVGPVAQSV